MLGMLIWCRRFCEIYNDVLCVIKGGSRIVPRVFARAGVFIGTGAGGFSLVWYGIIALGIAAARDGENSSSRVAWGREAVVTVRILLWAKWIN